MKKKGKNRDKPIDTPEIQFPKPDADWGEIIDVVIGLVDRPLSESEIKELAKDKDED